MACVPTDKELDVLLGTKDEVLVALLLEGIHHNLSCQGFIKWVIFSPRDTGDVVPHFLINVDNDVDVALSAPLVVFFRKFDSNAICNDMGCRLLLNQVEVGVQTQMSVQMHKFVLGAYNDLH